MPKGYYKRKTVWNKTKPLKSISDIDAARLAMAIDCEGCICHRNRSHTSRPNWIGQETRMLLYNTDIKLLEWVYDLTGLGKIRKHNNGKGALPTIKTTWVWECSYLAAYQVIKRIYPWILLKKNKAFQSLEWYKHYEERGMDMR